MATIKSYTDISQSKKLAEILPLESADMRYQAHYDSKSNLKYVPRFISTIIPLRVDIPCWSLAALVSVLPQSEYENIDLCFGGYEGDKYIPEWFCSYEQQEPFIFELFHADNPVDTCVEMIIKLHELNLL